MTQHIKHWYMLANCTNSDDTVFYAKGKEQHGAKRICDGCVVKSPCLAEALDNDIEFGVWGGMTERERRALKKRRPEVKSWAKLLRSAEAAHAAEQVSMAIEDAEQGVDLADDDEIDD